MNRSASCFCDSGHTPGGPNESKASELYHDDVVLESPQSGEWFEGKGSQQGWRERYPAKLDFQPQEIRGSGDLWIAEGLLSYDGGEPLRFVKIMQFRGDKLPCETLYFADPFPAPQWRQPWVANGPRPKRQQDLPEHVIGGNWSGCVRSGLMDAQRSPASTRATCGDASTSRRRRSRTATIRSDPFSSTQTEQCWPRR